MTAASQPSLSIVIPTRNGHARLPETLESVAAQRVAASLEVVVVDDGSDDGTSTIVTGSALPAGTLRLLRHEASLGRGASCNAGIEAARGEIILLLDDDMTLEPGALEAHQAFHAANARAAARGRVSLAGDLESSCFRRFLAREERVQERALVEARLDLPFALCQTGHFSARRQVLLEAGGFDSSITRYGFEDIELGYRLGKAGFRIAYLPEAASLHRAYITDLDRYLSRHGEAGGVARQLAERHATGAFRAYLRVDGPADLGLGRERPGLVALRVSNRLLLRRAVRRALGSRMGFALVRRLLRAGEAFGLDRVVHLGYHVARDLRYFQGYFRELG